MTSEKKRKILIIVLVIISVVATAISTIMQLAPLKKQSNEIG